MENVRVSSGRVDCILGTPIVASDGKITGYTGVLANVAGGPKYKDSPYSTFQAVVSGTGAVTATVAIYGSNDLAGVNPTATALGTITLSGTTSVSDGFTSVSPWKYIIPVLTNLTGTGAACYVLMGV